MIYQWISPGYSEKKLNSPEHRSGVRGLDDHVLFSTTSCKVCGIDSLPSPLHSPLSPRFLNVFFDRQMILSFLTLSGTSSGIYKRDPNSFLFSLVNPSGLKPTKLPLIPGKEGSAIYCTSGYGPVFGTSEPSGYYDLLISNNSNESDTNQACPNNCYKCPEGQDTDTFLVGNYQFAASEIEVFVFEK